MSVLNANHCYRCNIVIRRLYGRTTRSLLLRALKLTDPAQLFYLLIILFIIYYYYFIYLLRMTNYYSYDPRKLIINTGTILYCNITIFTKYSTLEFGYFNISIPLLSRVTRCIKNWYELNFFLERDTVTPFIRRIHPHVEPLYI